MTQRQNETNDGARKGQRGRQEEREGGEGGEAGQGEPGRAARESGKDGSLISATLPLGGCGTARPEPEINEPVPQVNVWNCSGRGVDMWNSSGKGA